MQVKENTVHVCQEMGADSWLGRIKVKRSGQHYFKELQASKNRKETNMPLYWTLPHALYLVVRTWKQQKPEKPIWRAYCIILFELQTHRYIGIYTHNTSAKAILRRMKTSCQSCGSYCSSHSPFPQIIFFWWWHWSAPHPLPERIMGSQEESEGLQVCFP